MENDPRKSKGNWKHSLCSSWAKRYETSERVCSPWALHYSTCTSYVRSREPNKENAVATLVGRFMPIYFPNAYFIEEGCYILPGKEVECLGEVSPVWSIRQVKIDFNGQLIEVQNVLAAVEIKCPFPADEKITVH